MSPTADTESARAFRDAVAMLDSLDIDEKQMVVRAFTSFFHLANLSEENYRVETLLEREREVSIDSAIDSSNELTVAYDQLVREMGGGPATQLLAKLEFHPVFTAHPTEARRKAVEGKIRRISQLLGEHPRLGGSALVENERHLLQIDALVRTSPIAVKKPTPVEEADTIIDIFDNTLFDTIPAGIPSFRRLGSGRRPASCRRCARRSSIPVAGLVRIATATRTSPLRYRGR